MLTIVAQDTIVDSQWEITTDDLSRIISNDVNKTGELAKKKLTLFMDAKIMLRSNIDIENKLANGSIGTITKIV